MPLSRLRKNLLRRYVTRSMLHIPILVATLSGETKKAKSPRTTHQLRQRCKQPDMPAMQVNILHMSVTSLRSSSPETIQARPRVGIYIGPWLSEPIHNIHLGRQVAYSYVYTHGAMLQKVPDFPLPNNPFFSKYIKICFTASSTLVSAVFTTTSAFSGSS